MSQLRNKLEIYQIKNGENVEKLINNENSAKVGAKNTIDNANEIDTEKVKKKDIHKINIENKIFTMELNEDESEEKLKKERDEEEKDTINLYTPTANKFANFNFDRMYSKTNVCANCNIIYILIGDVFANFEEGENQSK